MLNTLHRVWFLSAYAYIYPHTLIYISPQQGRWDLLSRMRLTNRLKKWVWLTLRVALHIDFRSASEDGALYQQRYSSVIRRRVTVASSMFTRRAGAGSAEARRAGANGVWIEARRPEQKLGSRARAGSAEARSETRHCHFMAPAPSRN